VRKPEGSIIPYSSIWKMVADENVNYKFPAVLHAFLYNSYLFVANTRWCLRIYLAVLPLSLTKRRPSIWSNHKQQEPISTFKHWAIKLIWVFLSDYIFNGFMCNSTSAAPLMHIWAKRLYIYLHCMPMKLYAVQWNKTFFIARKYC
jgi:hypothetical protein